MTGRYFKYYSRYYQATGEVVEQTKTRLPYLPCIVIGKRGKDGIEWYDRKERIEITWPLNPLSETEFVWLSDAEVESLKHQNELQ